MSENYVLVVPLDASQVEGFDPQVPVKVVVKAQDGKFYSSIVKMERNGQGITKFAFQKNPENLQVMVGPADASDQEMEGLQTLTVAVASRQWATARENVLELKTIIITPKYWKWWLIWCRTFTITGRVVCADGTGVPGAVVSAYDVDFWWWWLSKDLVDTATTDADGHFTLRFRWCCGWWPWWWWRLRRWILEPELVERITPILHEMPELSRIPRPEPKVDLSIFEPLLKNKIADLNILTTSRLTPSPNRIEAPDALTLLNRPNANLIAKEVSVPDRLPLLQERLVKILPKRPDLSEIRLWPWYPWYPWSDCYPDIIFKVTQNCEGEKVIYKDSIFNVRHIYDTHHDVGSLVANSDACCGGIIPEPFGNCVDISYICQSTTPRSSIGGNIGFGIDSNSDGIVDITNATINSDQLGYYNAGLPVTDGDRPYAGVVNIYGEFGSGANTDYYEFEWENPLGSGNWEAIPAYAMYGFNRSYYGPDPTHPGSSTLFTAAFPIEPLDGHFVTKSRQYFESLIPGVWGLGGDYMWTSYNRELLLSWNTLNTFANGLYKLRVKSYRMVAGHLQPLPDILPQCTIEPETENYVLLRTDNQVDTGTHRHPCGAGTVHNCTNEPDTQIVSVKIRHLDGTLTAVNACNSATINDTDTLVLDFVVHDPEGHLSHYTLSSLYGDSQVVPLLDTTLAGWTLSPSPVSLSWAPSAAQVGPDYGQALVDHATAPFWYGGVIRLEVKATEAFPETCCYQIELWAYKRTVVNCQYSTSLGHVNLSQYSFMIQY